MKAIITEIIPQQNFEIVGQLIGEILTVELANQVEIQCLKQIVSVYKERITSVDKTEEVVVNVLFDQATKGFKTQEDGQSRTNYFIDVYASGKATALIDGDKRVSDKLLKYVGLCRYILDSHKYITLGLTVPVIGGKSVENIQMFEQQNTADASFSRMCRINFEVRIMERQELWDGIALKQHDTSIKLELTELGYKYEL